MIEDFELAWLAMQARDICFTVSHKIGQSRIKKEVHNSLSVLFNKEYSGTEVNQIRIHIRKPAL